MLYYSGGKFTYAISKKGHVHRLLLPMILHSGFFHIFWNVLTLLMVGFTVEDACGRWFKYLFLLLGGALGGTLFSAVVDPYTLGVGASSSLFAILAAMCIWFYLNYRNLGPQKFQYLIFFGMMIGFAVINGIVFPSSGIDSYAHLGGFVFGIFLGFLLLNSVDEAQDKKLKRLRIISIVALSCLTIAFTVALFTRPLPRCGTDLDCANIC